MCAPSVLGASSFFMKQEEKMKKEKEKWKKRGQKRGKDVNSVHIFHTFYHHIVTHLKCNM